MCCKLVYHLEFPVVEDVTLQENLSSQFQFFFNLKKLKPKNSVQYFLWMNEDKNPNSTMWQLDVEVVVLLGH